MVCLFTCGRYLRMLKLYQYSFFFVLLLFSSVQEDSDFIGSTLKRTAELAGVTNGVDRHDHELSELPVKRYYFKYSSSAYVSLLPFLVLAIEYINLFDTGSAQKRLMV